MRHEERERCFFRVTKLQTNNKFVTYIELEACPVERENKDHQHNKRCHASNNGFESHLSVSCFRKTFSRPI